MEWKIQQLKKWNVLIQDWALTIDIDFVNSELRREYGEQKHRIRKAITQFQGSIFCRERGKGREREKGFCCVEKGRNRWEKLEGGEKTRDDLSCQTNNHSTLISQHGNAEGLTVFTTQNAAVSMSMVKRQHFAIAWVRVRPFNYGKMSTKNL